MKKLIALIFLFIPWVWLLSQDGKSQKSSMQCAWQKNETDPFTGIMNRITEFERIGYNTSLKSNLTGVIKFAIEQSIHGQDSIFNLKISSYTSPPLCFDKDSKIILKSGESIDTINLLGGKMCGQTLNSWGIINKETKDFLKIKPVDLIRIQYSGTDNTIVNFDLKEIDKYTKLIPDYFIRTLKCFE